MELKFQKQLTKNVYKICLTGGPCSGKTTALSRFLKESKDLDYKILTVPEIATITLESGFDILSNILTDQHRKDFNEAYCQAQIDFETYYDSLAKFRPSPLAIILDRGVVDNFGYTNCEVKKKILRDTNWKMNDIRNLRYDLVLHMVTVAIGAESYYSTDTNENRYEDLFESKELDSRTLNEWIGHPNLLILDNFGKDFEGKMEEIKDSINVMMNGKSKDFFIQIHSLAKVYEYEDLKNHFFMELYTETYCLIPDSHKKEESFVFVKRTYKIGKEVLYYKVRPLDFHNTDNPFEFRTMITKEAFEKGIQGDKHNLQHKRNIAFQFNNNNNIFLSFIETYERNGEEYCYLKVIRSSSNDKSAQTHSLFELTTNQQTTEDLVFY